MEEQEKQSVLTFYCDRLQENGWEEIILRDEATGCKATIIPSAGAILNKLEVPHNGKIINNYRPYMVRDLIAAYPQLAGFFELRKAEADL